MLHLLSAVNATVCLKQPRQPPRIRLSLSPTFLSPVPTPVTEFVFLRHFATGVGHKLIRSFTLVLKPSLTFSQIFPIIDFLLPS